MNSASRLSLLAASLTLIALVLSGCFGAAKSSSSATGVAFATPQQFAVGTAPSSVSHADFNGDGLPDVVSANAGAGTVSVLVNTTVKASPSPTATVTASPTASVTVASPSPSPSGSPSPAKVSFSQTFSFTVGASPHSVITPDVDGDGHPDIVTGNGDGTITVLLNTTSAGSSTPNFSSAFAFKAGQRAQQETITAADINGDGKIDIICANATDNTVSVLLNTTVGTGTPSFAGPFPFGVGAGPQQVAVADVNSDGFLDLVTANSDGTATVLLGSTTQISFITNPPAPTFAQAISLNLNSGGGVSLVLADFNQDGLIDIAVATTGQQAAVLLNTTNINPVASPRASTAVSPSASPSPSTSPSPLGNPSTAVSFNQPLLFGLNGTPMWLASGTLAVGGHHDLVSANGGNNNVSIEVNQSSGKTLSFTDGSQWNAGAGASSVDTVDIDGDGKIDLVVADPGSNQISVLINLSVQPPTGTSTSPATTNGFGGGTTNNSGLGSGTSSAGSTSNSAGSTSSTNSTSSSLNNSTSNSGF